MMKKLLFFLYSMMPFATSAMTIGSDTAVSRFNNVVSITNGARIAGFAALYGGFSFAGSTVTGIFDSFFTVAGSIAINGGKLVLDRDLILNDVLSIGVLGTIYGNRHIMRMPVIDMVPTLTGAASSCYTWSDLIIQQVSNTFYHDLCITFTGNSIWTARGNIVEFGSTCKFYIAANASLMFRDMTLVMDGSNAIIPLDSTSTVSFNNMTLVLDNNYTFSLGRLDIINDVFVQGKGSSFIFSSTVAGHINTNSRLIFDTNTIFRYAPNNSSRTNFVFDDTTGQLVLQSATLSTSSIGLQLTQGKIMFDGLCMLINQGNSSATSLQIGDGVNSDNNVTIRWLPACNVELAQGMLVDANV